MKKQVLKQLSFRTRAAFRKWLRDHHDSGESIWIEFYKDGTKGIAYRESLEEALCFGWIDSLVKKIDERIYVRKFSPRRKKSAWSDLNKRLVKQLTANGKMTQHGIEAIEAAKKHGTWHMKKQTQPSNEIKAGVKGIDKIIRDNGFPVELFERKSERMKRMIADYYYNAKSEETRRRRLGKIRAYLEGRISIL